MKLGELCEVMNMPMCVECIDKKGTTTFWIHGISFQQKIHRCREFAGWDVVAIEPNDEYPCRVSVEIVKPEGDDE